MEPVFNTPRGEKPTDPPIEWNSETTYVQSKPCTSPTKTGPVILAIIGRLNHHAIDNGDVEVHPSEYTFESYS